MSLFSRKRREERLAAERERNRNLFEEQFPHLSRMGIKGDGTYEPVDALEALAARVDRLEDQDGRSTTPS